MAKRGTALYHATTRVPLATPDQTVGEVLQSLRSRRFQSAHHIFVVNSFKERRLAGVVSTRVLFSAPDEKRIGKLSRADSPSVFAEDPEEKVAVLAIRRDFDTIPVVERGTGRFLGTVEAEELLKILHEKHTEQLIRRAGVLRDGTVVNIFRARVLEVLRLRLPWLIFGFGGGILITVLMSRFEEVFQQTVVLAYFIPVIAYMNAAVGAQGVSLFVRGMSLEDFSMRRYVVRELKAGLLMGAFFGALIFLFSLALFGSLPIAQTVGLSLFLGIVFSTLNAMLTPYLFRRFGKDPALGSDPLVTIIQDAVSILIYLAIASVLVLR